ncbi:nitrite reductase (NADH) small subunit/p-cumate 2,3-dioxygenase ferredoxin subunit [Pseudonocardia sediminis]|uniref:Nitrite reductase (NADH) small subunit/p-cumate 2,3-dioxygenase ferredoxin subunit n=1 Tax=Pseudonocardia sediminis TaxID=1397368 RepID=A0A4Q7UZ33_PSEST|nr:Rieske 2Fe-2S domain-containing protein [Pseudonocardia sediminis]RZT87055.1 nitrite reductase (NADH) small subunit/p-cumate 2,3-dioxygenase ferredoxin subunit [Pseudonocardia sediminis]
MLLPIAGPGVVRSDDGRAFAVFEVDDGYRVTDALCPHNKGPLDQGWLRDGSTVVCPWHWYRFDLDTGECDTSPQHVLGVHPVVDVDGVPHADVGGPPAPLSWSERLRAHARGDG